MSLFFMCMFSHISAPKRRKGVCKVIFRICNYCLKLSFNINARIKKIRDVLNTTFIYIHLYSSHKVEKTHKK